MPWSVGLVAIRGDSAVNNPISGGFLGSNAFSREGVYFAYQDSAWHYQTMYYHGMDANPDVGLSNIPMNGFFFEAERDLGWQNHLLLRYDVASSDTLNRQIVADVSHNILPNFALIGEIAAYPHAKPQIALQIAYAGPYEQNKRFLSNLHVVPARPQIAAAVAQAPTPTAAPASAAAPGDANNGAKLVQANGCAGCHGANLQGGGVGPALYGIEHKLTNDQIADFIVHPRAPMPNFGFTAQQVDDVVAYLSGLDGGAQNAGPVVTFDPATPVDIATITVRFPGTPPVPSTFCPPCRWARQTCKRGSCISRNRRSIRTSLPGRSSFRWVGRGRCRCVTTARR